MFRKRPFMNAVLYIMFDMRLMKQMTEGGKNILDMCPSCSNSM